MNVESETDEFRDDRAGSRPGRDGILGASIQLPLYLAIQLEVDEGPFFQGAAHKIPLRKILSSVMRECGFLFQA